MINRQKVYGLLDVVVRDFELHTITTNRDPNKADTYELHVHSDDFYRLLGICSGWLIIQKNESAKLEVAENLTIFTTYEPDQFEQVTEIFRRTISYQHYSR